jgi:putative restriction endonuclease
VTPGEIKNRFSNITVWRRGGERAPHKPLLALYAIARLLRGAPRMIAYREIDRELGKLLMEFGPRRQFNHPEYPFWRLQNDGLWEVSPTEGLTAQSNTDAKKTELLAHNVHGGFLPEIFNRLSQDKHLARDRSGPAKREFPGQYPRGYSRRGRDRVRSGYTNCDRSKPRFPRPDSPRLRV